MKSFVKQHEGVCDVVHSLVNQLDALARIQVLFLQVDRLHLTFNSFFKFIKLLQRLLNFKKLVDLFVEIIELRRYFILLLGVAV